MAKGKNANKGLVAIAAGIGSLGLAYLLFNRNAESGGQESYLASGGSLGGSGDFLASGQGDAGLPAYDYTTDGIEDVAGKTQTPAKSEAAAGGVNPQAWSITEDDIIDYDKPVTFDWSGAATGALVGVTAAQGIYSGYKIGSNILKSRANTGSGRNFFLDYGDDAAKVGGRAGSAGFFGRIMSSGVGKALGRAVPVVGGLATGVSLLVSPAGGGDMVPISGLKPLNAITTDDYTASEIGVVNQPARGGSTGSQPSMITDRPAGKPTGKITISDYQPYQKKT